MSSSRTSSSGGGTGFLDLLAIVFITLKLTGTIDWSWWWVLCPIWGPLAFVALLTGFIFVGMAVSLLVTNRRPAATLRRFR